MLIRRAEDTDEAALSNIRQRAILELAVPTISLEQAKRWAMGAAPDRVARAIREHVVWVAVAQDVIGWVEVNGHRLAALYVAPVAAGQGVGSGLLEVAETSIAQSGFTVAHLEASPNALSFYLRRGYVHSGPQAADGSWPLTKELITV